MGFLSNLPKEFIKSTVRQVGRDGGKVISNKIYKGEHGTPIYNSGRNSGMTTNQVVDISEIDMNIQPKIKGGGIVPVLKGLLFQVIPIVGQIAVLIKGLSYLGKKTTKIYATVPNKVTDRRHKGGYRIDGYSLVKTNADRYLQPEERRKIRNRGISYLLSIVLGVIFYAIIINSGLAT